MLCLFSALLFATFLRAPAQGYNGRRYACYSCALNEDISKCRDPYISPPNIPVEPGLCDKISELKAEQGRLCKRYTQNPGYNVVCNVGQMSFSCKASCGLKVKDVGNFSNNPHFRNSIGSNLLKSLDQESQEQQNVDLLKGAGGFGKDFGFPAQQNGGGYGGQTSQQLLNQASNAHRQNQNVPNKNNNNNNNNGYNNNPYLQSFDQNYQPHGAFDVYKPLTLPGQNPQYSNFNFQPLPPPKRTVPNHPPTYQQPKAPHQQQAYGQQGAPAQGYPTVPQNQGGYQRPQNQGYEIKQQPGYPQQQPIQNQAGYPQPQAQQGYPQPIAHPASYGQPAVPPSQGVKPQPAAPVYNHPQAPPAGYPAQPAASDNQAYPQPHAAIPHDQGTHAVPHDDGTHAIPHPLNVAPIAAPPPHAVHPDPTPTNLPVGPFLPRDHKAGYQPAHQQGAGGAVHPTHATLPLGKPNPTDLLSAINAIPHKAPHDEPSSHHVPQSHLHNILAHTVPHVKPVQVVPAHQDHFAHTGGDVPPNPLPTSLPANDAHGLEGVHLPVAPAAGPASQAANVPHDIVHPAPAVGHPVPHLPVAVNDVHNSHANQDDPHVDQAIQQGNVPRQSPALPNGNSYPENAPQGGQTAPHADPATHQANVPHQKVSYPSLPDVDPHANPYQKQTFSSFKDFEPFPGQPSSSVSKAADPYANSHDGSDIPALNLPNVPDYGLGYNVQPKKPHDNYAAKAIGYPLNSFSSGYGQAGHNMLTSLNNDLSHQENKVQQNKALAGLKGHQNKQTASASSNHGGYNSASSTSGSKQGGNTVHFAKGDSSNLLSSLGGSSQQTGSSAGGLGVKDKSKHGDTVDAFMDGFHGKPQSHDMFKKLGNHAGYFQGFNSVAPKSETGKDAKPSKHVFSNPFFSFMNEGR